MEDKKKTVKDLCSLLKETHCYKNIIDMTLEERNSDAYVVITFETGTIQQINVSCDSCFGIIADVVNNIR